MQTRSLSITSVQTVDHAVANTWTAVPEFIITAPEDGNYDIKATCIEWNTTAGRSTRVRLAVNDNPIGGAYACSGTNVTANIYNSLTVLAFDIPLKSSDVVSLQAIYVTGATTITGSTVGVYPSIQIIKRGV
jgi:hypothetical protein